MRSAGGWRHIFQRPYLYLNGIIDRMNQTKEEMQMDIGIIGGADGPTSIFISSPFSAMGAAMVLLFCLLISYRSQ